MQTDCLYVIVILVGSLLIICNESCFLSYFHFRWGVLFTFLLTRATRAWLLLGGSGLSHNTNVDLCVCLVFQTGMSFYDAVLFISLSLCWSGMFSTTVYSYAHSLCPFLLLVVCRMWALYKKWIWWTLWKITHSRTRWKGVSYVHYGRVS